jgi:hypothetical protein
MSGGDVRFWHIASFRCAAKFGRYWRHSGHRAPPALNGYVANDPKRTSGLAFSSTTMTEPNT